MVSRPEITLPAVVLSGLMLYFGTGLTPIPWLTWLAPLPVLLLAPRVPAGVAAAAACTAWLAGELNLWGYATDIIGLPPALWLVLFTGTAVLFALVTLLTRALMLRGRLVAAALTLPACWVGAEYLFAVTSPDGAFWSLAYTQTDVLPVLQIASLTGHVGITFLVTGFSSTIAVLCTPGTSLRHRIRIGIGAAAVLFVALAYGALRLAAPLPVGEWRHLTLISVPGHDPVDVTTAAGDTLLETYLREIRQAATGGAQIVVLPEAVFLADVAALPALRRPFVELSDNTGTSVVVGVAVTGVETVGGERVNYNSAQVFSPGAPTVHYRKQHLLFSEPAVPGDALAFVPGTRRRVGIAICKDMDFPPLARRYRRAGAALMLVPAWDFGVDGWLHSRMAIVRSVANGFALARVAEDGVLTVSDAQGRVLAEASTGDAVTVISASVSVAAAPTLYSRVGDLFAWLSLAAVVVFIVAAILPRHPRPARTSDTGSAPAAESD